MPRQIGFYFSYRFEQAFVGILKPRLSFFCLVPSSGERVLATGHILNLALGTRPFFRVGLFRAKDRPRLHPKYWEHRLVSGRLMADGSFWVTLDARTFFKSGKIPKDVCGVLTFYDETGQKCVDFISQILDYDFMRFPGVGHDDFVQSSRMARLVCSQEAASIFKGLYEAYGGHVLRRDDRDAVGRYDGTEVGRDLGHVKELQEDLKAIGFSLPFKEEGSFCIRTEWAVREFQIYAKMPNVAQKIGDDEKIEKTLQTTPNTAVYTGPVCGVVNSGTGRLIKLWKTNKWRCPVVMVATRGGSRIKQNIWLHDEAESEGKPLVHITAYDFTSYPVR